MMTDDEMIHCKEPKRQMERAIAVMRRLRAPGGCPWDAEQTHESIISNMIEECYECIDAIREQDDPHLREELGDVLLQVLFHADMAQGRGVFDINDVACELADKLVRRHPHVFGSSQVSDTDGVLTQWDAIKRVEQSIEDKPYLQNCGKGLPALMRAAKISKKAAKVGFDWESPEQVIEKLQEEIAELQECAPLPNDAPEVEEELGDILFCVVNLCRKRGVDPELALDRTTKKFERRFAYLERQLKAQGKSLAEASLDEMEAGWLAAKREERG
ncbi:MAG: nucleoside triphosphate pyrophosphohydrolase [Akkermansia sp.]